MWRTFLLIYCRVALPVQTPVVELQFDQVLKGLNEHSLIYIDVRNQTEVVSDGRIPGSFVIPGKFSVYKSLSFLMVDHFSQF